MTNGEKGLKLNFPDDDTEVYPKKKNENNYFGVFYNKRDEKWCAQRWSKNGNKSVYNGYYKDEEKAARASDTLARELIVNGENGHKLNFPDDDTELYPKKTTDYIGVIYQKREKTWRAERWSKHEYKTVYNGTSYKDEETAALASDTLTRKLMEKGEKGHKLNFPDDKTEVFPREINNYFGVNYNKRQEAWYVQRHSKHEKKQISNGYYKDKEKAAHASDTLARKLMTNGEKGLKLNFPDDDTEVYPKKKNENNYFGVFYNKRDEKWCAQRWSKNGNKSVYNGYYKDEETAARASDTLARELIVNGEKGHKLNFPDEDTEEHAKKNQSNKRKRPTDFENSQKCERLLDEFENKENGINY